MSRRNMVPKEVIDIEVDERRIYLLECMCDNDSVKKYSNRKTVITIVLLKKFNERKIKFLRISNTQSIRWRQGIN